MKEYIAHKREDGQIQSVKEHLEAVARLSQKFADSFGAGAWGYACGIAHDIGKYSSRFLSHILNEDNEKVDHSTAGAQELWKRKMLPAAFCVAGHHGGLPDGGSKGDAAGCATLYGRKEKKIDDCSDWRREVEIPAAEPIGPTDYLSGDFFIRMLYSCLVDADFLDTEAFMSAGKIQRGVATSMAQLCEKLDRFIAEHQLLEPQNQLNEYRARVLAQCIEKAQNTTGLFSLTVPTGGGKTISSLAFALQHARMHGMQRVIYVIPYCSIIDQTAKKFKEILGAENVLEHHSSAEYEAGDNGIDGEASVRALATENWDMPVIVTTTVQFFESIYANRPAKCRKLHNLANSVIVFDEAQMIPIPYLRPCVSAMEQLIARYRSSIVLCTATQPKLERIFQMFYPQRESLELCEDVGGIFAALKRVQYQMIGKISNEELAKRLQAQEQVLCIVNSRKQAKQVFERLQGEGNYHLSTLMYPAHRADVLERIRQRLEQNLPCRVVATSLIEAGVDVDFPTVYRAAAGLDSMIQAGGRCNREGQRSAEVSIVYIFESAEPAPLILAQNYAASKYTLSAFEDIAAPQAISAYFDALYNMKGTAALDQKGIIKMIEKGNNGKVFPFRDIAAAFRLIESNTKTVYIPVGNGEKLVERLQAEQPDRALFRELGRYGVSIYEPEFLLLCQQGDVVVLEGDPSSGWLKNEKLYHVQTGLDSLGEPGKGYFH